MSLNDAEDNKEAFIARLIEAGWTRTEAEKEWGSIQQECEDGLTLDTMADGSPRLPDFTEEEYRQEERKQQKGGS